MDVLERVGEDEKYGLRKRKIQLPVHNQHAPIPTNQEETIHETQKRRRTHITQSPPPVVTQTNTDLWPILYNELPMTAQYLSNMIDTWKNTHNSSEYELEIRLGRLDDKGCFESGVSAMFMSNALKLVSNYKNWVQVTPWMDYHEYFFFIQPPRSRKRKNALSSSSLPNTNDKILVRTSVQFKEPLEIKHVQKITQDKADFKYHSIYSMYQQLQLNYDIRLTLVHEKPIPEKHIPDSVEPHFVRIKSRKSFFYAPPVTQEGGSRPLPILRYDFTRSWSGKSRTEAEKKQKTEEPTYEIELEWLNPTQSSDYIAYSMLLKIKDFIHYMSMGTEKFRWVPFHKEI